MTKYGSQFAASTDVRTMADGSTHNAAVRAHDNLFDLAVDGNTSEALKIADIGPGNRVRSVMIDTDANLSGVNFKIGTATDDDKYGAAVAGPNATVQIRYPLLARGIAVTTEREEILLTPSGSIPSSGTIRTTVLTSHR